MAFGSAFFPHHLHYLPPNLSMLMQNHSTNQTTVGLPIPGTPFAYPPSWNMGRAKSLGDGAFWSASLPLSPSVDPRHLVSLKLGQVPGVACKVDALEGMKGEKRWNSREMTKWGTPCEWWMCHEPANSTTMSPQRRHVHLEMGNGPLELAHLPSWQRNFLTPLIARRTEEEKFSFNPPVNNVSEDRQEERLTDTTKEVEIASRELNFKDLKTCPTESENRSKRISHSIRDILKPKENCKRASDFRISKRSSSGFDEGQTKKKSNNRSHYTWTDSKTSKSIVRSVEASRNLHMKLKRKVISVFTVASSSFTQTIEDVPQSKESNQSTPSFDFLQRASSYSHDMTSPTHTRPVSPESTLNRGGQSDRKTFHCPQCRYVTDRKNNLKRHIVTMHQDSGKVLECCGVPFQSKAALRDHNTVFHRGGYRCQICARNFCRKALLRRHLTVHSGQKDFFCELCGYATSHKSNLERHQKVHAKRTMGSSACAMGSRSGGVRRDASKTTSCSGFDQQTDAVIGSESPSFLDEFDVDVDFDDEGTASLNESTVDFKMSPEVCGFYFDHDAPSRTHELFPSSRLRGRKARFFTSRLEETYNDDRLEETYNDGRLEETYNDGRLEETYNDGSLKETYNNALRKGDCSCDLQTDASSEEDVEIDDTSNAHSLCGESNPSDDLQGHATGQEGQHLQGHATVHEGQRLQGHATGQEGQRLQGHTNGQEDQHLQGHAMCQEGQSEAHDHAGGRDFTDIENIGEEVEQRHSFTSDLPVDIGGSVDTTDKRETDKDGGMAKGNTNERVPITVDAPLSENNEKTTKDKKARRAHRLRLCPLSYDCHDCRQSFPSQQQLYLHSCLQTAVPGQLGISLVSAVKKGCVKSLH